MNNRNYAKHLLQFLALILKQWLPVELPPGPGWGPGLGTCEGAEGPVNCSRALLGARRLACVLGVASMQPLPHALPICMISPHGDPCMHLRFKTPGLNAQNDFLF